MTKTQKALKLIVEQLHYQNQLLCRLVDVSLLHEASLKGMKRKVADNTDLLRGLQVVISEHGLDIQTEQRAQNEKLQQHDQRLRTIEQARSIGQVT